MLMYVRNRLKSVKLSRDKTFHPIWTLHVKKSCHKVVSPATEPQRIRTMVDASVIVAKAINVSSVSTSLQVDIASC